MERRATGEASRKARVSSVKKSNGKTGHAATAHANGKRSKTTANGANGTHASETPELDRRELLSALVAFRKGDFSRRLPVHSDGLDGRIADAFNDVIERNANLAKELERVSRVVGKEGRIAERATVGEMTGAWADTVGSVNALVSDLVHPTSETARVIGAVAKGDLSQTMALEVDGRALQGEFLRTAKVVNRMVDQLGSFASEVTRVAREVGTEGKLGGQAAVKGVAGTWKDLTDSVNSMAGNLTAQVRNIAMVTTAVANGDLSKKITVDVKGEILELKDTINTMVDQLRSFASEVTRVAREVGTEGKLGGQGRRARRRRHLEGSHRQRQFDGRQSHQPGAQHRHRHHRRRQWRSFEEDHRRREGRDPRAEDHHQHHGRSAELVRQRGDARGPRGRHRGKARRPGRGARCGRHLERPHR